MVATKSSPKEFKDLSTWLTRTQVVDIAGISLETLRRLEERGLVHPQRSTVHGKTSRAVLVYDPQELANNVPQFRRATSPRAAAVMDPGEQTARAFEMFERGASLREVVIELRLTVPQAEALLEQYRDVGRAVPVDTPSENKPTKPAVE